MDSCRPATLSPTSTTYPNPHPPPSSPRQSPLISWSLPHRSSKERGNLVTPVSFGTIYDFLFRGEATLRNVRAHWSSPPPHLPPSLKRSRQTIRPKRSRTGIRVVFRRRGRVAEGLVAVQLLEHEKTGYSFRQENSLETPLSH